MSILLKTLHQTATSDPDRIALQGSDTAITYGELDQAIAESAHCLNALDIRALGLLANNGLPWAQADLAALAANIPLVPLPLFFSPGQILHVIGDAGLDALLTDQPRLIESLLQHATIRFHHLGELCGLHLIRLQGIGVKTLPPGTAKVTYTSGTTGEPKGVCLSLAQMESVAVSLRDASEAQASDQHLCLTPLSTLLENIGGIYTPLLTGARTCLLPLQDVGLSGASSLDVGRMLQCCVRWLRQVQVASPYRQPSVSLPSAAHRSRRACCSVPINRESRCSRAMACRSAPPSWPLIRLKTISQAAWAAPCLTSQSVSRMQEKSWSADRPFSATLVKNSPRSHGQPETWVT